MVLDKPDITRDDQEADRLYLTMARLFELHQRYQEIKHKSETLLDMTDASPMPAAPPVWSGSSS